MVVGAIFDQESFGLLGVFSFKVHHFNPIKSSKSFVKYVALVEYLYKSKVQPVVVILLYCFNPLIGRATYLREAAMVIWQDRGRIIKNLVKNLFAPP